ncbi:MAG TPA: SAM-dependent chlorinase/fluorinase [Rhodothermales bacterium]
MSRIITLTTDFGTRDAYVATMKGVMLGINPDATLVDVTHDVHHADVMEAAFSLRRTVPFFPEGSVHLVVVDPGVGTMRRAVALQHDGHFFVGPDNGLFPLLLGDHAQFDAVELDRPEFWRSPNPSKTFHGRDIFAPIAAHLSLGEPLTHVGSRIDDLAPLHWALPIADEQGIQGWVVHVDHFGNCITNITREIFESGRDNRRVKCYVGTAILDGIHETYGSVAVGEPLLLFESTDHLEIAVSGGNAADLLGIRKGAPVNVLFLS